MKRSDLNVGESYYYDRSTSWETGAYGERAVVVDEKRYTVLRSSWGIRHDVRHREDPKGTAVLVDLYRDENTKPRRAAVPVAHLRGPWEETRRRVAERGEEARAEYQAESNRRVAAFTAAQAAVDRARAVGVIADLHARDGEPYVQMAAGEFERLLDIAEHTWGTER